MDVGNETKRRRRRRSSSSVNKEEEENLYSRDATKKDQHRQKTAFWVENGGFCETERRF